MYVLPIYVCEQYANSNKQTVHELFANTNKDVLLEQEGWYSNNILKATVHAKGKNVSANIRGKVKM